MKLNLDCVRDILLTVEANDFGNQLTLNSLHNRIPQYALNEIEYACLKLNEADMIDIQTVNVSRKSVPSVARINELTFYGHEFLDNIRSDEGWKKVSSVSKQFGSASLKVIANIAAELATSTLKSMLGI